MPFSCKNSPHCRAAVGLVMTVGLSTSTVITKGYGEQATMMEGQNAFAPL